MQEQVILVSNDSALSEVSLKCGDPFFIDFPKNIYSQAIYRAERTIAKDFGILDRIYTISNTSGTEQLTIGKITFLGEWWVTLKPADTTTSATITIPVNTDGSYTLKRKQWDELYEEDTSYSYAINFFENAYVFRYTPVVTNDMITIYYTSTLSSEEDYGSADDQVLPALPNKYYEEIIRRAVIYIARLGIVTFDKEKGKKYTRVLQLYQQRADSAPETKLERERPWIKVKSFSTEYP